MNVKKANILLCSPSEHGHREINICTCISDNFVGTDSGIFINRIKCDIFIFIYALISFKRIHVENSLLKENIFAMFIFYFYARLYINVKIVLSRLISVMFILF